MIRWSYVLPRLLLIAALLGFAMFGLDPLLRWGLVKTGERLLGASVELDSVRTSLSGAKIQLTKLAAADPASPMQNLFEADTVVLDLDAESLLLRRLVVDRGHVSGLRVNGGRTESGQLDRTSQSDPVDDASEQTGFDAQWLASLGAGALVNITSDFESIQMIDSAKIQWEQRFRDWETRIDQLRERAKTLKAKYRNIDRRDPVQIAKSYQQLPRDIDEIRNEFAALQREIEATQSAAQIQLADLSGAHQRDLMRWREKIRVDQFNAIELSNYILGPMLNERMAEVLGWVEHCQTIADSASPKPRETSSEEIRFGPVVKRPDYLIRELFVDGLIDINGEETPFGVVASDIAFPPSRYAKPSRFRLVTQGDVKVSVDGVLDYRGESPIRQFHVACPELAIPATTFGKQGEFVVHVDRGHASVECDATYQQGGVVGEINFVQSGVSLKSEVSQSLGNRIRESLHQSLASISELSATIRFQGDPRLPSWTIESQLGDQLSSALQSAVAAEIDHQQAKLRYKLDAELANRKAEFAATLEKKKQALLADLNLNAEQLQQIMDLPQQLNVGQLGLPKEISLNGLLRR